MKKWIFIFAFLIPSKYLHAINKSFSDTFQLDNRAILFLQSKIQNIDFKICDEEIILNYIKRDFNKQDYERYNEFEKKKYIVLVRDTLNRMQQEYSFDVIYSYTSRRILGDYNFDKKQFPIVGNYYTNGGQFPYSYYKNESQVVIAHASKSLSLVNSDKFPLTLDFNEDQAEKILNIQKQMRREYLDSLYKTMDERTKIFTQRKGVKFKDDYGNYAENEDRIVNFRYFIKVLNPQQNKSVKKKALGFISSLVNTSGIQKIEEDPNALRSEIIKIEVNIKGGSPVKIENLYIFFPNSF